VLKAGIDTLSFYTSSYVLDLATLAQARGVDANKFFVGLGQQQMSVPPPGEDIVTMAANAGLRALEGIDKNSIGMVLFATESGFDQSKAAGIYVHDLLELPPNCRVIEFKQACYGGTFALQMAIPFLQQYPTKKVLLLVSDVARYGLGSLGESSQGCGAVAMVLSLQPRILAIEPEYGVMTENVMDFWRPNYADAAIVDGRYSSRLYLTMLEKTWLDYQAQSGRQYSDHAYFCYHSPVPRLVEKAHHFLAKLNHQVAVNPQDLLDHTQYSLEYGRKIGNSYSAALYIGMASLLDLVPEDLSNQRLGFYSYGSGCVAEFFSGVVQSGYRDQLDTDYQQNLLKNRQAIDYAEYEKFYNFNYPQDGSTLDIPVYKTGQFRLAALRDHKRIYEKVS
jgi:hydroxymethylglutaryl-CoA synthase